MSKQHRFSMGRPAKAVAALLLLALVGVSLTSWLSAPADSRLSTAESTAATKTERALAATQPTQRQTGARDAEAGAQEAEGAQTDRPAADSSQVTQSDDERNRQRTGRSLTDLIELLNADNFVDARTKLDELMQAEVLSEMTPFELARVYQLSFNLNMQDEAYEAAQADLQAALESGGLNEQEVSQLSYQNAQLYVQREDYAKAADSLELWIAEQDAPNPAAYYLLAASYYYQEKFDDARDHMETMMSMPGEKQEGWYSMMASLYIQGEDYAKARAVVEQMVALYDDERYRKQLADLNMILSGPQ